MNVHFTADIDVDVIEESLCENSGFIADVAERLLRDVTDAVLQDIEIDLNSLAEELDLSEIARAFDVEELSTYIDLDDLASEIDREDLASRLSEIMPDQPNSEAFTALQAQVDTLTTTVERLMGVLDWSLENMRRGVVLSDGGVPFTLGDGVQPVVGDDAPTAQPKAFVADSHEFIDTYKPAPAQQWDDRPNYL